MSLFVRPLSNRIAGVLLASFLLTGFCGVPPAAALRQAALLRVADPAITPADLSVPIYPGAAQAPGAFRTRNANGFAVSAAFTTRAPRAQVVAFYRAKMSGRIAILPGPITTTMAVSNSPTDKVMITVLGSSIGTRITIMHTIKPAGK